MCLMESAFQNMMTPKGVQSENSTCLARCGPSATQVSMQGTSQFWKGCHIYSHLALDGKGKGNFPNLMDDATGLEGLSGMTEVTQLLPLRAKTETRSLSSQPVCLCCRGLPSPMETRDKHLVSVTDMK